MALWGMGIFRLCVSSRLITALYFVVRWLGWGCPFPLCCFLAGEPLYFRGVLTRIRF